MNRGDIINLQTWLKQQGFYRGQIDGLMGPRTDQAIKAFQRYSRITPDGIVGPDTQRAMKAEEARDQSHGGNTFKVQVALFNLGLYNGKVDGIAGPMTKAAIKTFQRQNHLVDDGIVGTKTFEALFPDIKLPPPSNTPFYIGAAKRIEPGDIERLANDINLDLAIVKAFLLVESNGKPFDAKNRPTVLFEPHLAYRFSSGGTRSALVDAGLAYAKWGTKPYPKTMDERFSQIDLATKIAGAELAADSASWGSPQICGFNARPSGYSDAVSMVRSFAADEENQMTAMGAFILNNEALYNALKRLDWATAAEMYNGAAYRKNKYDEKLLSAYKQFKKE